MAGISVDILEASKSFAVIYVLPAPLLSVEQTDTCNVADSRSHPPDCRITAITVQIPYELGVSSANLSTTAVISENGQHSREFTFSVVPDNLHVLTTCDTGARQPSFSTLQACNGVVTHADGTLVAFDSPAKAGETVVIYAFGLGQPSPAVKTGEASPTPAAVVTLPVNLQFDFRSNAGPSRPYINPLVASPVPVPAFVGLTPGQVGLYQINVTIPSTIPAVERCGTTCAPTACTMYNTVQSNLTIDIGANASFDGAAICVQPPQ